jgi:hypothetical protein
MANKSAKIVSRKLLLISHFESNEILQAKAQQAQLRKSLTKVGYLYAWATDPPAVTPLAQHPKLAAAHKQSRVLTPQPLLHRLSCSGG